MTQLFSDSGDIERAVAEFKQTVGILLQREQADRLERKVAERRAAHKPVAIHLRELVEARRAQVELEAAVR